MRGTLFLLKYICCTRDRTLRQLFGCLPFIFILFFSCFGFSSFAAAPVPGITANGGVLTAGQTIQVCIGTTITYENSSQRASFINWRFKNGNPSSSNSFGSIDVQYSTAGTDTTFQTVINGKDTVTMFVIVKVNSQKPKADFTFSPNGDCGSVAVAFNSSSSTGSGLTYSWDFDDDSTSTVANPSYAFVNAIGSSGTQNYSVKLSVTNNLNCSDSITKTVTIKKIPSDSVGNARSDVTFGPFNKELTFRRCASLPFYDFAFNNISSTIPAIKNYTISWGEGSPDSMFNTWASGTVITHVFPIGKSIMKVSVLGANGCTATKNYIVFLGTTPAGSLGNIGENSICATKSLTFPLHDFSSNAVGTTYSFVVNDGTPVNLYQHPPPDSITHFFNSGSCTNTSSGYENAYSANLFIENPCGSTSSQIVPLYVSGKPRANLDIHPQYNICVNSAADISNASSFGGLITTTGGTSSTCTNTGKQVWQITPSTGYTITGGVLGSTNGNLDNSTTWSEGSANVDLVFDTPGNYDVKVYAGNDNCGVDSLVKTVCVRTPPQAAFTMNKPSACAPDSVVITNTSADPGCLGDTYQWDIFYSDPQNCGNTGGYTFTNGTSSSSKDPVIKFTEAGRYIIKLTVTANGTGFTCAPDSYQDTFLVKAKPKAILKPVSAVCIGNTVAPAVTAGACYGNNPITYNWTFVNGTPATSSLADPGNISYSAIGNFLIRLEVGNECGLTIDTDSARITSTPVAKAGPDQSVCSGMPAQLGDASLPGISYSWNPATGLTNPNIADPVATLTYNGLNSDTVITYVVTAAAGSNCSATDTVAIRVRKNPVVTVTPVSSQICEGSFIQLVAAGAGTYVWSPADGLNTATGDTVIAGPLSTTSYTVTGTALNGCTADAITLVNVIPYITPNAGADSSVCNISTAIQLTGTPSGGTWSGNAFINANGVFNASAAGNGAFTLYYTAGTGACLKSDSVVVNVIDAPVANAGADTTVCQSNNAIQLTASPAGGKWSNSPFVSADGLFTPAASGTYTLIYTIGNGSCIDDDTVMITVAGGITNNTIGSEQSICTGGRPAALTGSGAAGGNGAASYQWQYSSDGITWSTITGANATGFAPGVLVQDSIYRRIASTALCSGPNEDTSAPVKITVNPNATASFDPITTKGCVPFIITPAVINLTTPSDNSVSEYKWYVNGNYIGSGENFPGYTMNNTGDSITVRLIAISAFGCKNDTAQHGFITVERPTPSFSQSDTAGCGPLDISFTNTTPNPDKYNYVWDFGQGQTSTDVQPGVINFPINPTYGDTVYMVTMKTISACDTLITQHRVNVRSHPKVLFTPDKSAGCSPLTVTFANTSRGSNDNYTWDFDDGSPQLSTNNFAVQHTYAVGTTDTFYVHLTGSNDCGIDSQVYAIVVKPSTIRIDFALNGVQRYVCAPDTVSIINNTIGANNFKWDFGDGDTLLTSRGVDTILHSYTAAGNFIINLYASNGCTDTTDKETITVGLKPKVSFTASTLVSCITGNISFTNTSDAGISNQWTFGDGATSVSRDPVKSYNSPGNYRVQLTGSNLFSAGFSCSDSAYADIVIQDTLPGDFSVSDSVGNCTPFTVTFKNNNLPSLQTNWMFGDSTTATGDSVTHTFTNPGSYNVIMTSRGTAGCLYKATRQINVNAPSGTLSYMPGYTCIGDDVRFEVKANNTDSYTFIFDDGDSLTTTSAVISHRYLQPGNHVPYAFLTTGTCSIKAATGDTIKADKINAGFKVSNQMSCGTTAVQLADTSYAYFGVQNWQWNFGDGTNASVQNPLKTFTQNASYNVRLAVTGISGCTDTVLQPVDIEVRNYPLSTISADSVACTMVPVPLTALIQSQDAIVNAAWTFGNGTSASGLSVSALYNTSGNYTVQLIASTGFGCSDTAYKKILINTSPVINSGPDVRICLGQSVQLSATGGGVWQWTPIEGLSCNTCFNPVAKPVVTTAYVATGTNAAGCSIGDTVLVTVVQPLQLTVSANDTICIGKQTQLFAAGATGYSWDPATGLSSTTAPNPIAAPTLTTQYRVIGKDSFNCFTDTGYVTVAVGPYPTVDLGTGAFVVAGTVLPINPVITNGPIKQYTWTPTTDLSCYSCPRPIVTVNNNISYKVEVENIYGCTATDTINFTVICDEAKQVFIPNAFSPDGDNINDLFMIRGKGLASVKYFRVFNRWGELVFERNNFNANDARQGWDGKVRGVRANPDVYVYTAEIICSAGGTFIRKGNVTLFR